MRLSMMTAVAVWLAYGSYLSNKVLDWRGFQLTVLGAVI